MANGEPIPEEYRPLVTEILKRSTINQILEVEHYRKGGGGSHKDEGGMHYLAGRSCFKSPSTCESTYQKYRHLLNNQDC